MENNKVLTQLRKRADGCSSSLFGFAGFVNDAEGFAERMKSLFATPATIDEYHEKWLQLEVLNACALDEWESAGRPKDFSSEWNSKYKRDADKLVNELLLFIQTCMS